MPSSDTTATRDEAIDRLKRDYVARVRQMLRAETAFTNWRDARAIELDGVIDRLAGFGVTPPDPPDETPEPARVPA